MFSVKKIQMNSLRLKILCTYIIGMIVSFALVIVSAYWFFIKESDYFASADIASIAQNQAKKVRFNALNQPIGFDFRDRDLIWVFDSLYQEAAYRILDVQGKTVFSSAAGPDFWKNSDINGFNESRHFKFNYNGSLIHGSTAVINQHNKKWYLQFAVSARFHDLIHQNVALPFMSMGLVFFGLVLLCIFGLCAYFIIGYTLKPLNQISEAATAISPKSIHIRLNTKNVPNEIVPLVESFNSTLERLENGFRIQQEFLATAAHELKTPLALIRAQIEMAEDDKDKVILLNDVEHMTRQVQQLLMLAEVSEIQNYILVDVKIVDTAIEVIKFLQPMADRVKVQLILHSISNAIWKADHSALFVLLKNLVENAVQHSFKDSVVIIEIDESTIKIRDRGAGISDEDVSKLFVRFWRGSHRRDQGAGLGLSICQEIVQAHGWSMNVNRGSLGLEFVVLNYASSI